MDYIVAYEILGGEPLINGELADMIRQIGDRYGNRIGNIGIITNGTLLPDEQLIEISKKYMSFEDIGIDFHLFIVCVSLYTFPFSSIPSIIMSSGAVLSGV